MGIGDDLKAGGIRLLEIEGTDQYSELDIIGMAQMMQRRHDACGLGTS
jgi:hypothetical protein